MASNAASGDFLPKTSAQAQGAANQAQQSCFSARNLLITGLVVSILAAGMGLVAMQQSWVGTTGSIAWIATGGALALAFTAALVYNLCKKRGDSSQQPQPSPSDSAAKSASAPKRRQRKLTQLERRLKEQQLPPASDSAAISAQQRREREFARFDQRLEEQRQQLPPASGSEATTTTTTTTTTTSSLQHEQPPPEITIRTDRPTAKTLEEYRRTAGNLIFISEEQFKLFDLKRFNRQDIEDLFKDNGRSQRYDRIKWASPEQMKAILESGYEGEALRNLRFEGNEHKIPADVKLTEGQKFLIGQMSFDEMQSKPHLWHLLESTEFEHLDWTSKDSYFQKLDKNAQHDLLNRHLTKKRMQIRCPRQLNAALATGWTGRTLNYVCLPSDIRKLTAEQFEAFCREQQPDRHRNRVRAPTEAVRSLQPKVLYDLLVEQKYEGWALDCISGETLENMMRDRKYKKLKNQITDGARARLFPNG